MWSLIFIVICSPGFFGAAKEAYTVTASHVDNFISRKLCEDAGKELVKNMHHVEVQYTCALEIN